MGLILTDSQNYTDIADAIRTVSGSSSSYLPSDMPREILRLVHPVVPIHANVTNGKVDSHGDFTYSQAGSPNVSDVYALEQGRIYLVGIGLPRTYYAACMVTPVEYDPQGTDGYLYGDLLMMKSSVKDSTDLGLTYVAGDGETLIVQKADDGSTGTPTFVIDITGH